MNHPIMLSDHQPLFDALSPSLAEPVSNTRDGQRPDLLTSLALTDLLKKQQMTGLSERDAGAAAQSAHANA